MLKISTINFSRPEIGKKGFDKRRVLNLWKRQTFRSMFQKYYQLQCLEHPVISQYKDFKKIKVRIPKSCSEINSFEDYLEIIEKQDLENDEIISLIKNLKSKAVASKLSTNEFNSIYAKVAFISVIKAVIAPVLESLILIDRVKYLKEMNGGGRVSLINLFDYNLSPRNMALIATKGDR